MNMKKTYRINVRLLGSLKEGKIYGRFVARFPLIAKNVNSSVNPLWLPSCLLEICKLILGMEHQKNISDVKEQETFNLLIHIRYIFESSVFAQYLLITARALAAEARMILGLRDSARISLSSASMISIKGIASATRGRRDCDMRAVTCLKIQKYSTNVDYREQGQYLKHRNKLCEQRPFHRR